MASKPIMDPETPLAYSVIGAAKEVNCSRSELYNRLKRGDLRAKKLGRRTIILRDDLAIYLASLPDYSVAA